MKDNNLVDTVTTLALMTNEGIKSSQNSYNSIFDYITYYT